MARAHYNSRSGALRKNGRALVPPRNDVPLRPITSTRTTLVVGERCAVCTVCLHLVRVKRARRHETSLDVQFNQQILVQHTVDGTRTHGMNRTVPCLGSLMRARSTTVYTAPPDED